MLSYALKRVTRSTLLFAALLLGVILASTFFAGINIGADTTAKAALDQQLDQVVVDLTVYDNYGTSLSSANWVSASEKFASVDGVVGGEVITRVYSFLDSKETWFLDFRTVGLFHDSRVYDGLTVVSGASSLQENETYVWIGSEDSDQIELGDVLSFNYTLSSFEYPPENVSLNLEVVGFVSLDEDALAIASGDYGRRMYMPFSGIDYSSDSGLGYPLNLLITDWEKTFAKLVDKVYSSNLMYSPFDTQIMGFIDRETVINPWSIDASQEALTRIGMQIDNKLAEFGLNSYNNLEYILLEYQFLSMSMRLSFLVVAIPVFFVAWYVGSTVSQVSFNLRRREIGLLSARGFSSGQLFRLFLSESLVIGILGGLIGLGLSFVLSPYFIPSLGPEFGGLSPVLSLDLVLLVIGFSTALTFLSTFRSSRQSAKLPTLDALREHLYVEETKVYKQKWAFLALFLGSYKLGMTLVGIPNLASYFSGGVPMPSNIFLTILLSLWIVIDGALTPFAPLLFFWGFTKTVIRGSKGFQTLVSVFSRFLGDIGTLATKNVKRNPTRSASVAFLVALIIGYSFLTVGTLASEEDYIIRDVKADVGADISVYLDSVDNATTVMNNVTNLQGVESATLEYSFSGVSSRNTLSITAVEPQEWLSTAYYEDEWFSGQSVTEAFQEMVTDNNTIILARGIASTLDLQINDYIAVTVGDNTSTLRVVGFFGSTSSTSYPLVPDGFSTGSPVRSYVPHSFYNSTDALGSPKILVNLEPEANATLSTAQIRDIDSDNRLVVVSVSEQLENQETNLTLSGTINVQRIGVIFAVVAASVATSLIALVSLQERKKEVAIMNIRGLSLKQVTTMLLSESLSVVIFATVIGCVVGMILIYGNVVAANAETYASIVSHRIVFPLDSILILAVSLILVFLSTILPVILITRRYVSKLERIVRS